MAFGSKFQDTRRGAQVEKHDVESPWYKRCVEVGSEKVDVLEKVALFALETRESSRDYFVSLWSLRFDATEDDKP
ncbi:MAG: hypothetical protein CMQ05_16475 [Gammaproteobacteria bacterium]|nr:hypothetical protein [Gammaproteobacteria bacterium]